VNKLNNTNDDFDTILQNNYNYNYGNDYITIDNILSLINNKF
jgi:hypothetical protein